MRGVVSVGLLLAALLGGCTGSGSETSSGLEAGAGELQGITGDTGGIRGVVVDARIVPVAAALVTIGEGRSTRSDASGYFNFTGLKEGDYFVKVSKAGYETGQTTTHVTAGLRDPPVVKVLLTPQPDRQPYWEPLKLEGFYECGFAFGFGPDDPTGPVLGPFPVITDQCDVGTRTAYDEANGTVPGYPAPRNVMKGTNTQLLDVGPNAQTAIQQAYWSDSSVPKLMVTLSSVPIRNDCDCSDTDYMFRYLMPGEVSRSDASTDGSTVYDGPEANPQIFPAGITVASRGFLSWETVSTAQNFRFTIVTSLFHNYEPDPAWTFETSETFPVG